LSTTEGPLLLDLHDLGFTAVREDDFRMTSKISNPDTWMVLQELTIAPFSWPRRAEGCNHDDENNLRTVAFDGRSGQ